MVTKWRKWLTAGWPELVLPAVTLMLVFAFFAITVPDYISVVNLQQLMRDYAEPAMVAMAIAIVIFAGGIDLSVGAIFAIANFAALYFFRIQELPLPMALLATLAVGISIGSVNGLIVAYGRARPFLATLAMLLILRAGYDLVVHSYTIELANAFRSTSSWDFFGMGVWLGIPANMLILGLLAIIVHLFLTRTGPGLQLMATGGGREAANNAGVPVKSRLCLAYIMSGVIAATAGFLYATRQGSAGSDTGQGLELTALSAIVLGGISLSGGRGSVARVLMGAGILFLLLSGLLRMNAPGSLSQAVSGGLLLVAVAIFIKWEHYSTRSNKRVRGSLQHSKDVQVPAATPDRLSSKADHPLLQLQRISKRYTGSNALKDIDLEIYPGEIHALLGENGAGKSTLGKIIVGATTPSSGKLILKGKRQQFRSPADAIHAGLIMVYQESSLVPTMTVAGNLLLGHEPWFCSTTRSRSRAVELLNKLNYTIDPDAPAEALSTAQRQMVELARAISNQARLIVFDEPTASLSPAEARIFYQLMQRLSSQGVAIILVTHALEEALAYADRITVLRDGNQVRTDNTEAFNRATLIELMIGRDTLQTEPFFCQQIAATQRGDVLLTLEDICNGAEVRGVSLELHKGEILGLSGLLGAGRTETAHLIAGLERPQTHSSGSILLHGRKVSFKSPRQAIKAGISYITEDRVVDGIFDTMSIDDNIYVSALASSDKWQFWYSHAERRQCADYWIDRLSIRMLDRSAPVAAYSGGNQQKVVIAKALAQNPEIVIFDEPTRGVDVVTIPKIHSIIREFASEGKAAIVISSYFAEIKSVSDRILVLCEGMNNGEFQADTVRDDELMEAAIAGKIN